MKANVVLRLISIFFVIATAVLLVLTVTKVVDSADMQDALVKLATVCVIVAGSAIALTFLSKK